MVHISWYPKYTLFVFFLIFNKESIVQAKRAVENWGSIFIKAANQGSSVGCYQVNNQEDVEDKLNEAFNFQPVCFN